MSKIGSNIRKIRTVKGLNQSQFAELFDLNRARIGAYEEGRAEPKIDVVIEIAKYFYSFCYRF
jgi:transcriptional regulator with XRE-family HTH domain